MSVFKREFSEFSQFFSPTFMRKHTNASVLLKIDENLYFQEDFHKKHFARKKISYVLPSGELTIHHALHKTAGSLTQLSNTF